MRSLALKITLAFLLVSLAGIVLVAIFTGRATAAEFGHFMMAQDQDFLSAELADYYQVQSGWTGVERVLRGGPPGMGNGAMHGMVMGGGAALVDTQGNVVVAGGGYFPGERLAPSQLATGIAILVDGQRGGTLIPAGNTLRPLRSEEHTSELQSQSNLVCRLLLEKKKSNIMLPSISSRRSDDT